MTPHEHRDAHGSWSERADAYDRDMSAREPALRDLTEALLDAAGAGPGIRLLDLACGPGHATAAARARGADVLGIDVTPAMIDAARRRFPGVPFAVADMRDPPAGPWDAITCRLGAHHVDDAWLAAASRVLAPGGRLAIAELAPIDERARRNGMREADAWVEAMARAGFVDVGARRIDLASRRAPGAPSSTQGMPDGPAYVVWGEKSPTRRAGAQGAAGAGTLPG